MTAHISIATTNNITTKPFLKWAGGKYRLASVIRAALPQGSRLIEPFVGSGAVFLNMDYPSYVLADSNHHLIDLFQLLKSEGGGFIDFCQSFFDKEANSESVFYQRRDLFNATNDIKLRSALFVYLNRHCFNGLCRYNAKGFFNVPFGRYKSPLFPRQEMLAFHRKSQYACFNVSDFSHTMKMAQKGDIIYTLTDGYPDQFGGVNGKKFKTKQLQEILVSITDEPMETQKQKLNRTFDQWKGDLEQVDDVCVVGIKI